ncbi:MAG: type II secretion system F family protein [Rhodocyclaceae bacterium]|nr:type II secretion system F family protein [Rhodocyclaceae bacterium]MBX3667294.1 type II secretion system F family protein [Rhodocyclaceae bacterium]
MLFQIKGMQAGGQVAEIAIEAPDEAAARAQAAAGGLVVLSARRGRALDLAGSRRARFPLLLFGEQLLALLAAGIPLIEAIETLAEKEQRDAMRAVLMAVRQSLRNGLPLSAAAAAQPAAFPPLFVAMLRAAERTSDIEQAIRRYVDYRKQMEALRARLVAAATYPMLLLIVGSLVVLFLLAYVVPRFSQVYTDLARDLPFASRWLLAWGEFVSQHFVWVAGAFALAVAGLWTALQRPQLRLALSAAAWATPWLGEQLRMLQLARLYRTVGMLLRGGLPLVQALEMVDDLLAAGLRLRLLSAVTAVREGGRLSDALARYQLGTPVALRMLRVGERAGNLGEMLERAADFHDEEIARNVDWLTRLVGPLLMLAMGVAIGLVVVLMYLPIFQLAESLQ